jgi:hypothetical protein
MHKDTEGIPKYINALEDAQKQSKCADENNVFSDHELLVVATAAMMSTQQYKPTNLKWEDLEPADKTWAKWKTMYKAAEAKAKVGFLVTDRKDQFGAAYCAEEMPLILLAPHGTPPSGKTQHQPMHTGRIGIVQCQIDQGQCRPCHFYL